MKSFFKVSMLCILAVALSLTSFGAQKKIIGIVTPNATHGFLAESIKHAKIGADEFTKGTNIEYKFMTSAEASQQNNQMDELINAKVDAIVLWPHNGDELRSSAIKAMNEKIPLIVYDRLINGVKPTVEILGDNPAIGKMTAKYFNKYFEKELKAGIVNILEFKGDNSTVPQERSKGFASVADKKIKIVQQFDTGWQRAKAQEQMENFLNLSDVKTVESINGVFTHDDEVASGVIDAIINYKGNAKLNIRLISGVQARKESVETFETYKKKYNIDQVTYLFSPAMIRNAIKVGVEIAQEKKEPSLILIPTVEVDTKNYKEFMKSADWKIRYGK
ncbi:MAG: substrate-binding domain-containing protein [Fusobacteriaceae bacterium]